MESNSLLSAWLIWFILGVGLAFLELVMPGFIILFFGIGCLVTAAVLIFAPLPLTAQIAVFLVASVLSLVLLRKWLMRWFRGETTGAAEKEFDDAPIGKRVSVLKSITPPNPGRIRYRGSEWDAEADAAVEAGSTVEITGYAGGSRQCFTVRPV